MSEWPVVVIGAGPLGLAAAAHLLERGLEPLVLEAGGGPAAAVAEWGHVRLFSAWPELVDKAAVRLLEPSGWTAPGDGYPTGAEWADLYLRPLAAALRGRVRYGTPVTGVSRKGRDRLVDAGRENQPFTVHVTGPDRTVRSGWRPGRSSTRRGPGGSRTRPARTGCPPWASGPPRTGSATRSLISPCRSRSRASTRW